jgi:uncharacterized protein (TIGR00299 family) protein
MAKVLYFDCFSGASGDMVLGALLDAGLPLEELQRALGSLAIGIDVTAGRVQRSGVSATKFRLSEGGEREHGHHHGHDHDRAHDHGHDHHGHAHGRQSPQSPVPRPQSPAPNPESHHHPHRSLAEIAVLIDRSALSDAGKAKSKALFARLAEAEAAIHDMPVDQVHLHEVGALDSIVDIVGAVFGLEWFGADEVVASPLNVGSGTVECAHGTFPVPAPATARLLQGVPVYASGVTGELVTPTGALLVTAYATRYGPLPAMRIERVGYGAGDRETPGAPNVLRLFVGEASAVRVGDRMGVVEFEVDDMNPQIFGPLMDRLYAAGAHEVFYVPVQMKKGRPGTLVTVVAPPDRREAVSEVIFRETTTIGLRYQVVERECLAREIVEVSTPVGAVRVKVSRRGGRVVNALPEFEDCARLAAERGRSIKEVHALAAKAYLDREGS